MGTALTTPTALHETLLAHLGHRLQAVQSDDAGTLTLACETCGTPLLDATKPVQPIAPGISAEVTTDDQRAVAQFDCSAWFAQASDDEILAVAREGWNAGEASDRVALWYEDKHGAVNDLFDYLRVAQESPAGDTIGFTCYVNETEALRWLQQHHPSLHARLTQEDA